MPPPFSFCPWTLKRSAVYRERNRTYFLPLLFRVKSLKSDGNIVGHIQFDNCNAIHYANECSDVIKQGLSTFTGAEEEFIKRKLLLYQI